MKRKQPIYKGLQFNDVYYTDNTLTSPDFFQITEFPTQLTAGKNLIKFKGNQNNLAVNSYLNVEVLDFNGDPVYYEIVNYIDEDRSRIISIYIYPETSPGDCIITLLGEAINVPDEWRGKGNIKWSRSVSVNPTVANSSEIIFETLPIIEITEQIGPHLDRSYAISQFPTYSDGTIRYFSYNGQPAIELTGSEVYFTDDMKTGTITVSNPTNPLPESIYTPTSSVYTSTIKKILTPTTALLNSEYIVYSNQNIFPHTYNSFDYSSYSLSYKQQPTYTTTQNSESYALIQISDLQPATGDISRIKVFANNNGTIGTWEPVADIELQETDILVPSTSSLYPERSIGSIVDQTDIDTYWTGVTYLGKTTSTAPDLTFNISTLMNSIRVSGSVNISGTNDVMILKTNSTYKGRFYKDSAYKVQFNAVGVKSTNSNNQNPKIQVYLSGSAFNYNTQNPINSALPTTLGKLVGEKEITSTSQRLDDVVFSFEADNDGDAVLQFVIHSGEWYFSDIHVTTDNDAGYTPTYTRIKALTPTAHKIGNQLTFKIEYYNVAGVKSKQQNFVYDLDWEGGNRYIDGNYSMLTGSLYVADSLESGVAISGYPNSGFIRSLGYNGFNAGNPGFLLWSGSAMPASTTTYQGVGLELYADTNNYFRYRTDPSELIVRTQKFFLGSTSPANFISGSNGNLEISSSNFHLDAAGNVTASYGEYRGTNLADLYKFRVLTINTSNSSSLLSTYTNSGNTYYCLNLTGSYDPSITGTGPAMFIRIGINLLYPIAAIAIHPDDWSVSKYQRYATYITLEAGVDFYITENITPPLTTTPDSEIKVDLDDIIHPGFHNRNVNGTTYANTLKVDSGTRVFLAQSAFDWKMQSITSFTSIPPFFPTGSVTNGTVTINGTCSIDDILILQRRTTTPSSPTEGMIIASGSAGSSVLYYYNGTTWNSLF